MISDNLQKITNYILIKQNGLSFEKLNILLYYCQGWNLALSNKTLFDEDFIGGVFGPNIPELYIFLKTQYSDIKSFKSVIPYKDDNIQLPKNLKNHIDEVLEIYAKYHMFSLTDMIRTQFPYINSRKNLSTSQKGKNIILKNDMKKYFLNQLDKPNVWLVREKFLDFWITLIKYLGFR